MASCAFFSRTRTSLETNIVSLVLELKALLLIIATGIVKNPHGGLRSCYFRDRRADSEFLKEQRPLRRSLPWRVGLGFCWARLATALGLPRSTERASQARVAWGSAPKNATQRAAGRGQARPSHPPSVLCATPCFGSQRHHRWPEPQAPLWELPCTRGLGGVSRNGRGRGSLGMTQGGSCGTNQVPLRGILISEGSSLGCNATY